MEHFLSATLTWIQKEWYNKQIPPPNYKVALIPLNEPNIQLFSSKILHNKVLSFKRKN